MIETSINLHYFHNVEKKNYPIREIVSKNISLSIGILLSWRTFRFDIY